MLWRAVGAGSQDVGCGMIPSFTMPVRVREPDRIRLGARRHYSPGLGEDGPLPTIRHVRPPPADFDGRTLSEETC